MILFITSCCAQKEKKILYVEEVKEVESKQGSLPLPLATDFWARLRVRGHVDLRDGGEADRSVKTGDQPVTKIKQERKIVENAHGHVSM